MVKSIFGGGSGGDDFPRLVFPELEDANESTEVIRWTAPQRASGSELPSDPTVADRIERQQFWTAIMRGDLPCGMRERLRAAELLGRSQGDFVKRIEARITQVDEKQELDGLLSQIAKRVAKADKPKGSAN